MKILYKYWQHEETGCVVKLLFWKTPGHRYYKIKPSKMARIMVETGLGNEDMRNDITMPCER